jgi:long-subunit fatty acid transport protein
MRTPNRGSVSLALPLACACFFVAARAGATDATEVPDNGSEQGMRGGAWVARASDPLAAFYNPAGLAGQPTRLILQGNLGTQHTCFTRVKAQNDTTADGVNPGGAYPQVCNNAQPGPDPQLALTLKLTPKIGLGIAPLLAPSSASGNTSFPEFTKIGTAPNQPEPGRYILTAQNILLVTPTIGIGIEVLDRLRIGASFQFGIASFSFTNASVGVNMDGSNPLTGDLKAKLTGHDYFIPGFTLGTIWSPTDSIDLAGWYKYSAPIDGTGDVLVQQGYYAAMAAGMPQSAPTTDTSKANCGYTSMATQSNPCGSGGNASIHLARPMEAKIGFRYHLPRKNIPYDEHVRDPIAQDVFDVEADLTWANDSAMNLLQITFPGADGKGTIPINGTPGDIPPNADVPLHYSDVVGVRLGGDVNVLPDQLALRGGGFYQTPSQTGSNTQYQGLSFATGSMFGLAIGGTYRIHFGPGANALELSGGFEHIFMSDETYTGSGGVEALAGTQCNPAAAVTGTTCPASKGVPAGQPTYRTNWAVNLGTITNSANLINVGLGYRF